MEGCPDRDAAFSRIAVKYTNNAQGIAQRSLGSFDTSFEVFHQPDNMEERLALLKEELRQELTVLCESQTAKRSTLVQYSVDDRIGKIQAKLETLVQSRQVADLVTPSADLVTKSEMANGLSTLSKSITSQILADKQIKDIRDQLKGLAVQSEVSKRFEGLASQSVVNERMNDIHEQLKGFASQSVVDERMNDIHERLKGLASQSVVDERMNDIHERLKGLASQSVVDERMNDIHEQLKGFASQSVVDERMNDIHERFKGLASQSSVDERMNDIHEQLKGFASQSSVDERMNGIHEQLKGLASQASVDERMNGIHEQLSGLASQSSVDERFDRFDVKINVIVEELTGKLNGIDRVHTKLDDALDRLEGCVAKSVVDERLDALAETIAELSSDIQFRHTDTRRRLEAIDESIENAGSRIDALDSLKNLRSLIESNAEWIESSKKHAEAETFFARAPDCLVHEGQTMVGVRHDSLTTMIGALSSNLAAGEGALRRFSRGRGMIGVGTDALGNALEENDCTSVGAYSSVACRVSGQSAYGARSLMRNVDGKSNSAFGHNCLMNNEHGEGNAGFGADALATSLGSYNTAAGAWSLSKFTNGDRNSAYGSNSGCHLVSGRDNTMVGAAAGPRGNFSNTIAIGSGAEPASNGDLAIASADAPLHTCLDAGSGGLPILAPCLYLPVLLNGTRYKLALYPQ